MTPNAQLGIGSITSSAYWQKMVFDAGIFKTKQKEKPAVEIIGIRNFALKESTIKASDSSSQYYDGLTATIDSTTYPDRARLSFVNNRGFDVYLVQLTIDGTPIVRYKDALIHDSLRRDDDIRKNGEKLFDLENEYIIDSAQIVKLADYWFKYLGNKKHLYQLTIPGTAAWYEPGEWYHLSCGAAGMNEYIDSTVECYSVDCERNAGEIGQTVVSFREVEENWAKTTLYTARAQSNGSPKRRAQQSNTLIVASSTFDGTYDYKCDGTADDVEIQAAIDSIYYTYGGGTIYLTSGTYNTTSTIMCRDRVNIKGVGKSTAIVCGAGVTTNGLTYTNTTDSYTISDFTITAAAENTINLPTEATGRVSNVVFTNSYTSPCTGLRGSTYSIVDGCRGYDCNGAGSASAFLTCGQVTNSIAVNCNYGFAVCSGVIRCIADTCATYGFMGCYSMQQNKAISCGSAYGSGGYQSYADAAGLNPCADTAAGGYNS